MISGSVLRDAFISAANSISNNKTKVDELNVFPVPDGDTGTNMSMTFANAKKELVMLDDSVTVGEVAKVMESALLRGARGNSGVITSLLMGKGFSKAMKDQKEADAALLTSALETGVARAYKSVMKPTEGTILTVARLASVKAREICDTAADINLFWDEVCAEAERVLQTTPDLLPTLKKAGVVDAGGMGLCLILRAMGQVFKGEGLVDDETKKQSGPVIIDTNPPETVKYAYGVEYIITKSKDCTDTLKLSAFLETIGDSVAINHDDNVIKVHVYTNTPGRAIDKGAEFGIVSDCKLDYLLDKSAPSAGENGSAAEIEFTKKYGFVAVAAGDGIEAMFKDAGADCIVRGGQTMNPSTNDILAAINSCPAEIVFILPNNKNIIMAAEQAAKLAGKRKVCVLQTRTIPQGLTALLNFDETDSFDANRTGMTKAFERVQTGQVTFAARDSEFDGNDIKKGEILALDNGKLSFIEKDIEKAAYRLTKRLVNSDSEFITLIYGEDITDAQAESLRAKVEEKFGSRIDVNLVCGGQPVYYYIISVE